MGDKNCLFCKIVKGEIPAKKAYEDDQVVAFHDISPQAPIHVLVCPKKHIEKVMDLEAGDAALVGEAMLRTKKLAKDLGIDSGFRIVVNNGASAGQSVWHLHYHLLGGRPMKWPPG